MACELITATIRERLVTVTQMNCATGLEELTKLLTVLKDLGYEYLNGTANIHHHLAFIQTCNAEEAAYVVHIASKCTVEGAVYTPQTLGAYLQEDYLSLMEIFAFFVKANYKEFFIEGLQELEDKKPKLPQKELVKTDTE